MEENLRNLNWDISNKPKTLNEGLSEKYLHEEELSKQNIVRLQELENQNAKLKKKSLQQTKKLNDVIASNIKFISIIGHDLKNPFSSILGALQLLKLSLVNYDKEEFEELIAMADSSANTALNLMDNLLKWALLQNEHPNFDPVKINFYEILQKEIENINNSAKQKQISLINSGSIDLNIIADIQMIRTILRNLINNAIKYTNKGGQVTISTSETKQYVEIEVQDNGIGIPEKVKEELFKLNIRHSMAGTKDERGTGLGLLICKEFVEIHGGNIWVENNVDRGSIFKFQLPHIPDKE